MLTKNIVVFVAAVMAAGVSAAPVSEVRSNADAGVEIQFEARAVTAKKAAAVPARPAARPAAVPARPAAVPPKAVAAKPVKPVAAKPLTPAKGAAAAKPPAPAKGAAAAKAPPKPVGAVCRRDANNPCVGDTFTIAGKTLSLTKKLNGASRGGALVFEATFGGATVIAKSSVAASEFTATRTASTALGSGIFVADGTDGGRRWLILKKLSGSNFAEIAARQRFTAAQCTTKLADAVRLSAAAQGQLSTGGIIQGDENFENYLFNDAITSVNMIDFGVVRSTNGASKEAVIASQTKALSSVTFTLENMQAFGLCK